MSCPHVGKFEELGLAEIYSKICQSFVFADPSDKTRTDWSLCFTCGRRTDPVLVMCLRCVYVGCTALSKHMADHFDQSKHDFGVCLESGHVYCALCGDLTYDRSIEVLRRRACQARAPSIDGRARRLRRPQLNPTAKDVQRLEEASKAAPVMRLSKSTHIGLCGLVNMGNTCFMSCIVQALAHTPLLRDYFLSDQHKCTSISQSTCLMCEMAAIFQTFYCGERLTLVPITLLHLVWTHAHYLVPVPDPAGYEQQDAHEFLIAMLDLLHNHSRSSSVAGARGQHARCQCIVHRIFTGRLQSDLTFKECGHVSSTVDPFWDISLDLSAEPGCVNLTLQDCLTRYVRVEHLGIPALCTQCDQHNDVTKQFTFRSLPIVVCFHLKRFEQTGALVNRKVTTHVSFPADLDLTEYTLRAKRVSPTAEQNNATGGNGLCAGSDDWFFRRSNMYTLFAVVNHHGSMESGHYTCYIRRQAEDWFRCDDHLVTKAALPHVLQSEAYLLFYHKVHIDYR